MNTIHLCLLLLGVSVLAACTSTAADDSRHSANASIRVAGFVESAGIT